MSDKLKVELSQSKGNGLVINVSDKETEQNISSLFIHNKEDILSLQQQINKFVEDNYKDVKQELDKHSDDRIKEIEERFNSGKKISEEDTQWLLNESKEYRKLEKESERMKKYLTILKHRTSYYPEFQQFNFIAKQGLGEEKSPKF